MKDNKLATVKIAEVKEVPIAVAAQHLKKAIETFRLENPPKVSEFREGDLVILDTGWLGMVESVDEDGDPTVMYFDEDGIISGPAYGYSLTKVQL